MDRRPPPRQRPDRRARARRLAGGALALALAAAGLAMVAAGAALAPSARAASGRVYRNAALRIGQLELPRDWEMVPAAQLAYPGIVVAASNRFGGRLVVGVQRVVRGTSALDLAATARATLERQAGWDGLRIEPQGADVRLDASYDHGTHRLRQLYRVDADLAVVLSMGAPAALMERDGRVLDEVLRTLVLLPARAVESPAAASSDGGAPAASPGANGAAPGVVSDGGAPALVSDGGAPAAAPNAGVIRTPAPSDGGLPAVSAPGSAPKRIPLRSDGGAPARTTAADAGEGAPQGGPS